MFAPESRLKIDEELSLAEEARARGNEGRARVCARRAVGAAVRDVLQRSGRAGIPASALDLLRVASGMPVLSRRAQMALERLLQKVDEEFNLPQGWDLIVEAKMLVAELDAMI